MQALRNIGIIGRITLLEGARKQVFHVLMLFAVFLIFGSATLAKFDRHVQMKMLNDLCLFSVFLVSSVVAITLAVTGIPGEQEQKTVYPVIAKPVARWQFVCGKYAGAMGTVAIGMAVMAMPRSRSSRSSTWAILTRRCFMCCRSCSWKTATPGGPGAVAVHSGLVAAGVVPERPCSACWAMSNSHCMLRSWPARKTALTG